MTLELLDRDAGHPLVALLEELSTALEERADAPAWTLTAAELRTLLPALDRLKRRLDAVELRALRDADRRQVGDATGASSTAAWWAQATRRTRPAAHRQVALADRLDDDTHLPAATALAAGTVSVEQARVIVESVEALPAELTTPALRADAEEHLVALAEHHDPRELRLLGRRILDVLAPEIAEEHDRRLLEREEADALATASFSLRSDGAGSMIGRFKVPALAGEMLGKHLAALAAPRHRHAVEGASGIGEHPVARPLRLGRAFVEYIETREAEGTPKAGGVAATVVVTMTVENLIGSSEAGALIDNGSMISAAEARRLACEAGIIPAVLGSASQPLDLGRRSRFHTRSQRIALMLRDGGCAAQGCDWPPGMCHAHHPQPWSRGGGTSVENGVLLCPRHHRIAHDARYQCKADSSGRVTFTRRR